MSLCGVGPAAVHPAALAFSVGMLVGIYFIVTGIDLMILGFQIEKKT